MAETTTVTLDARVASRTRPAAWTMRSAPRRELPPNLKATTFLGRWHTRPELMRNAAGLGSPADSSCTFSGLMTCAPGFQFQVQLRLRRVEPLERLWRGLKRRTHRRVRFRRWVGNFF